MLYKTESAHIRQKIKVGRPEKSDTLTTISDLWQDRKKPHKRRLQGF